MSIDRLAVFLSRRRLFGAGLLTALTTVISASAQEADKRRRPTATPTTEPTIEPTATNEPTEAPTETVVPTDVPTETAVPPTSTDVPTETPEPPTRTPTTEPTTTATTAPTATHTASPTRTPTTVPGQSVSVDRVLLDRYRIDASVPGTPPYRLMSYRPGAMRGTYQWQDATWGQRTITQADRYAGWDVITVPNLYRNAGGDFLRFALNRPATVAVIWRYLGAPPSWLTAWTADGTIKEDNFGGRTYPVFRTTFDAGDVVLQGVGAGDSKDVYLVLLAERDGSPSYVQDGSILPNQTCPASVHDAYGGNWHREIDPVYWCYHRHEHGCEPIGPVAYGATAAAAGMSEAHAGFKTYVFDDWNGHVWQVTHHMGTAGRARVCVRFHTLDLMVWDRATGDLLIDYRLMADFGAAVDNDANPYHPADCPDQASLMTGHFGERMVPRVGGVGYEPWRTAWPVPGLGITGAFAVNTRDQITRCADLNCATVVPAVNDRDGLPNSGTSRFLSLADFRITPPQSGAFCTDAMGMAVVDCSTPGAIRQYAAGVTVVNGIANAANTEGCYAPDAWGDPFVCEDFVADAPTARENSIPVGGPN